MIDPRTPVIVGCGQVTLAPGACAEPVEALEIALDRALADSGSPALGSRADLVAVSRIGTGRYGNAAGLLAARRGLPGARSLQAEFGGQMGQALVADVAERIRQGRCEIALVAGGELGSSLRRPDQPLALSPSPHDPPETLGEDIGTWISHPHEAALGITLPAQVYPLLETALAWRSGRSLSDHMAETARLWAGFSQVAAGNPYAADRTPHEADEILQAGPANRYVGYPYTKLMNSDQFVDQAAALVLCSAGTAQALGVARDRWVFPLAAVHARAGFVSERGDLADNPALRRAGAALAGMTGWAPAEAELVDLYACFPAAVRLQAAALGIGLDRPLTVTGGMRFAGGPWNSYALHQIANLVLRLRERPGQRALCSANGGLATRFCVMAYAGTPAGGGYRMLAEPFTPAPDERRALDTRPAGAAEIEAFSVTHDSRNRPVQALATCRLPSGARAWATFEEADAIARLLALEEPGLAVRFTGGRPELA